MIVNNQKTMWSSLRSQIQMGGAWLPVPGQKEDYRTPVAFYMLRKDTRYPRHFLLRETSPTQWIAEHRRRLMKKGLSDGYYREDWR